jgi:hypothetical protein
MRWGANIALFVGAEVAYVGLFAALVGAAPSIALTMLAFVVVFTLPFLPIYLGLLAELTQPWTRRKRRLAAIAGSPLLIAPFIAFAVAGGFAIALLILALPGALAYGVLVRLPSRQGRTQAPANQGRLSSPIS